jgi:hypothetical protein
LWNVESPNGHRINVCIFVKLWTVVQVALHTPRVELQQTSHL